MTAFLRDLKYSGRSLLKSPGFTIVVVFSLAVGIGANAAIFSVVSGILLKPLPFEASDALVMLYQQPFKSRPVLAPVSAPNYKDWAARTQGVVSIAAFTSASDATLSAGDGVARVRTRRVSSELFRALAVMPAVGRLFLPDDHHPAKAKVAIITDALWQRHFEADPGVIGREIMLDGELCTVVGVSRPVFDAMGFGTVDVMLPLNLDGPDMARRDAYVLNVLGRLDSGKSVAQAQAHMNIVAAQVAAENGALENSSAVKVMSLQESVVSWHRGLLILLQLAILFVLLIACTNVASLLMARWTGRQQELAIRASIGASRWAILRLSLCESIILGISGTSAGIWLAVIFKDALLSVAPSNIPRLQEIRIDAYVLASVAGLSACTVVAFALVPLFFSRRTEIAEFLRQGGRAATSGAARQRLRGWMISAQVALTVILLSAAGLLIRSLWQLQRADVGFRAENLLTFHVLPDPSRRTTTETTAFYLALIERLKAVGGVVDVCAVNHLPFTGTAMGNPIWDRRYPPSDPSNVQSAQSIIVTPEYFRTLGIRLESGRSFGASDVEGAPAVVIINQTLARRLFPSGDAVGSLLEIGATQRPQPDSVSPRTAEIVGVAHDTKQWLAEEPPHDIVYVPFRQNPAPSMFAVVKAQSITAALAEDVRSTFSSVQPGQAVYDLQSMADRIHASQKERRFNGALLILFAGVALIATVVGIYGSLSYWVAQRRHEIGIRMALGARSRDVLLLVLATVSRFLLLGLACGLGAAVAVVRVARAYVYQGNASADLFFGVDTVDPTALVGVIAVLSFSTLIATAVPTWRAVTVNPSRVLQME